VTGRDGTARRLSAFELVAEELRLAQRALGEITGEMTSDDLLGRISRFLHRQVRFVSSEAR